MIFITYSMVIFMDCNEFRSDFLPRISIPRRVGDLRELPAFDEVSGLFEQ
jgi:hypothetical protein